MNLPEQVRKIDPQKESSSPREKAKKANPLLKLKNKLALFLSGALWISSTGDALAQNSESGEVCPPNSVVTPDGSIGVAVRQNDNRRSLPLEDGGFQVLLNPSTEVTVLRPDRNQDPDFLKVRIDGKTGYVLKSEMENDESVSCTLNTSELLQTSQSEVGVEHRVGLTSRIKRAEIITGLNGLTSFSVELKGLKKAHEFSLTFKDHRGKKLGAFEIFPVDDGSRVWALFETEDGETRDEFEIRGNGVKTIAFSISSEGGIFIEVMSPDGSTEIKQTSMDLEDAQDVEVIEASVDEVKRGDAVTVETELTE